MCEFDAYEMEIRPQQPNAESVFQRIELAFFAKFRFVSTASRSVHVALVLSKEIEVGELSVPDEPI